MEMNTMNNSNVEVVAPRQTNLFKPLQFAVNIARRETEKINPSGGRTSGYGPTDNKIEIEWTHSEADDYAASALGFNFTAIDNAGAPKNTSFFTAATDVIERVEFYHDSVKVINGESQYNTLINNVFYANEASRHHAEHEANTLMGLGLSKAHASFNTGNRKYLVPLGLIHPFFTTTANQVYPVLGSRMRLVIYLNPAIKVLSRRQADTDTYNLSDVHLQLEKVVLTSQFKNEIQNMISRGPGLKIPYIDYKVTQFQAPNANNNSYQLENHYNNALSLMLLEVTAQPAHSANAVRNNNWITPLGHRFGTNGKLNVRCGQRSFTYGTKGAEGIIDLYSMLEKFSQCFSNISGQGFIKFDGDVLPVYNSVTGLSPVVVSLERFNMIDSDNSVINRGLSALDEGSVSQIQIEMETPVNIPNGSKILGVLVHEKYVIWDSQGLRTAS